MTLLDEVRTTPTPGTTATPPGSTRSRAWSARMVDGVGSLLLNRTSRRGFLASTAVVGAAVATDFKGYALRPVSAYDAVCGEGSSCSSGWTAFCCTINDGKNQCPPGSFVGGWWKADGSGFCCGGSRYYIDCQNSCTNCSTGCGGYNSFCNAGCHTGKCGCASGTCDQRRVSCNYFRYGQCQQDVACGGPVACRVITCAPPWQLWDHCTTSSATDNRTSTHSAPCLPGQGCLHAIDQWWWDRGGPGHPVGSPVDPAVTAAQGGSKRTFTKGGIYQSSATGVHSVWGDIYTKWKALGLERSRNRYPSSEQYRDGHIGWLQTFQDGAIVWSSATRAVSLWGDIYKRYVYLGSSRGQLGYPVREEASWPGKPGAVYAVFQKGSVYWYRGLGAWALIGAIRDRYERMQGPAGLLRMPLGDPIVTGAWTNNRFESGWICWSSTTGAQAVWGAIAARYAQLAGPSGGIGPCIQEETAVPGGIRSTFVRGAIYWSSATGAHETYGAIYARYRAEGESGGTLGLPTSGEVDYPGGRANEFQRGRITWNRSTNTTTVIRF